MKRTVILSCNDNPDYLFCLPIVVKSWQLQGWEVICNIPESTLIVPDARIYHHSIMPGKISDVTSSQLIRLYLCSIIDEPDDNYVILSDADMFIGSGFLNNSFSKINVFGHDLTGWQHIPICYTGMRSYYWKQIFDKQYSKHLEKYADLTDSQRAWVADQDILTGKLKQLGYDKINFISRGTDQANHNLPLGRWDRYGGFKRPGGVVHDVHLPRKPYSDEVFPMIEAMCNNLYPNENWGWLGIYRETFVKWQESIEKLKQVI